MTVQALCNAIVSLNFNVIESFIGNHQLFNTAHPETGLYPIEYAVKKRCNLEIIKLLLSSGASLVRTNKRKQTHHNIVIYCLIHFTRCFERTHFLKWLLEPSQLSILKKEAISAEHLYAALGVNKLESHNLLKEDCNGLQPIYYAALVGNEHFDKWLPQTLQADFVHQRIVKGLYANTTGAWWLSFCYEGTKILRHHYRNEFDYLDLNAKPLELTGESSLLVNLMRSAYSLDTLRNLSDEKFCMLDWSIKDKNSSLIWAMTTTDELFRRIFLLDPTVLRSFDWNEIPLKGPKNTLAIRVARLSRLRSLFINLPAEILNTIQWDAVEIDSSRQFLSLINILAKNSSLTKLTDEFKLLLSKLTIDILIKTSNAIDASEPVYPILLIEILSRLNEEFFVDSYPHPNLSQEYITDRLQLFSELFAAAKLAVPQTIELTKRIKGLKGQIIMRFSAKESLANILLSMETPFFNKLTNLERVECNLAKVKLLAQYYLMQGKKTDRSQGFFHSVDLQTSNHSKPPQSDCLLGKNLSEERAYCKIN